VRGYLDRVDTGKVTEFERQMLDELRRNDNGVLEAIRRDRELKKETEDKLVAFLDGFAKSFAA